jgi:hypothetical protein
MIEEDNLGVEQEFLAQRFRRRSDDVQGHDSLQ